jgi:hypothetical protein
MTFIFEWCNFAPLEDLQILYTFVLRAEIDLMHNDVTRLDAREECWSQ